MALTATLVSGFRRSHGVALQVLKGAWCMPLLVQVQQVREFAGADDVQLWEVYRSNPKEFFDNRNNKKNPKQPDFKHKTSNQALWISNKSTPAWVHAQLGTTPAAASRSTYTPSTPNYADVPKLPVAEAWERLKVNVEEFQDFRGQKAAGAKSEKFPDLILNTRGPTGEATRTPLWVDSKSTPAWVSTFLADCPPRATSPADSAPKRKKADLLADFSASPHNWEDFREAKAAGQKGPKYPDLKHRVTGEVAWLS